MILEHPRLPRAQMFIWRILTNSIPTNANLGKHIHNIDPTCAFCNNDLESIDHLFLNCEFSKRFWFGSPIGLQSSNHTATGRIIDLINLWLHSDIESLKMGCYIIWGIWKARNKMIFEKERAVETKIIQTAISLYNDYVITANQTVNVTNLENSEDNRKWLLPPQGRIKVNVDGATSRDGIAVGIVVRDDEVVVLKCLNIFGNGWEGNFSAIIAEGRAFLKGIETGAGLGVQSFIVEGDSKLVVDYIKGTNRKIPWKIKSIIADCQYILSKFPLAEIKYVPREANHVAHHLAKEAMSSKSCSTWTISVPFCIAELVRNDKIRPV